jgi:integrase/recombinase XerD
MKHDDIDRFLKSFSLAPKSRYTYVTSLRAFKTFAQKRARPGETISIETVRAWLKRDAARSPFNNVVGRAGIIVRYLDWKAAATSHPFAKLKQHYGGRLMTIVRALLREDYRDALERLRPLPEWGSSLGPLMREHVARMQSLGYRYETRARDLRRFDRYLQRHPVLKGEPFPALIEAWQNSGHTPRHRLMVQLCARTLSQAMHRRDEKIPIRTIEIGLQRRQFFIIRLPKRTTIATTAAFWVLLARSSTKVTQPQSGME